MVIALLRFTNIHHALVNLPGVFILFYFILFRIWQMNPTLS